MALAFSRSALAQPIRAYSALLLHGYNDPHAEILTLLWCRRFDRELACTLLEDQPGGVPQVLHSVQWAADHFDQLNAPEQHRLRRLILRHRRGWDNARAHN